MKVDLDGTFGIVGGTRSFDLGKWTIQKKEKDNGEIEEKKKLTNRTYHSSLAGALKHYKQEKVRNSDCETLQEVLELLEDIDRKIERKLDI